MPHLLIRIKVSDYDKWKSSYDKGPAKAHRIATNSTGGHIFRDAEDNNKVTVLFEWGSMEDLQKYLGLMGTPETQRVVQEAGIIGPPEAVYIFGEAESV